MVSIKEIAPPFLRLDKRAQMTKEQKNSYQETDILRQVLIQALDGRKFQVDCGHHVTFGCHIGNDITIYNGKELKIICSQCGY
jgi:hypothetical protein